MNPSTSGWINKLGEIMSENKTSHHSFQDIYRELKTIGFVYGINVKVARFIDTEHSLSEDEKAKINLVTALHQTYLLHTDNANFETFLDTIFEFYQTLGIGQMSFLNKILTGSKTSAQLEKLIDSRIYLEDNLISKTFNSTITNSLLFIDILTFKRYLDAKTNSIEHARNLEYITINITYHALNSKQKNKSDIRLEQLFEASLTFFDNKKEQLDITYKEKLFGNFKKWENRYFLDVACLSVWEDKILEDQESSYIYSIGKDLGFTKKEITRSLEEVRYFFKKNARIVPFLRHTNLAVLFYDSMSKIVNKLIIRNSKRLQKELSESKELVSLISKATISNLSPEEKKKMQNQLIDIFKSIPSLAIFLLPGGAVLLPIFIKLIPKLLPSSFDDNRLQDQSDS